MLENQFLHPSPQGGKLIFFAPLGVGVNEENQLEFVYDSRYSFSFISFMKVIR
jgi:hypothetical protein